MTGRELAIPTGLTPPDCDLRDFGHMPLDVRKFRDSDLVALEEPEAIVAAVILWGAAWHQIPAASLPDDDRVLSNLAGYGRAVKEWRKVRDGALRGFIKCADGRLYHPLVAEKARTAWDGKLAQRHRTFCATIRKHNERHPENELSPPNYERWLDLGRPEKVAQIQAQKPNAGPLFDDLDDENVARDNADVSHTTEDPGHADVTGDMASKGKGERKGKGDSNIISNDSEAETLDDLLARTARITAAAGVSVIRPTALAREMDIVKRWTEADIPVDLVLDVIAKRLADMRESETVGSLAYFDAAILKANSLKSRGQRAKPSAPPAVLRVSDQGPNVEKFREALARAVDPSAYSGWLGPNVAAFTLNGRTLTVTTPSPFMADWVRKHFSPILETVSRRDVEVVSQ